MIAAIYARKSTDQTGVADDQRSVARQIARAEEFAAARGWAIGEEHVFVDDGVSGAEFARRPGLVRLLNALKPRPPFQIVIVSELSRLGREQIETAYALKQLSQAGVTVVSYLDGKPIALDSPVDKFLLAAVSFAAETERDKARQRTYDALHRKARAGFVTGGRVFGYDNHTVTTAAGHRSHVERQINAAEAATVARIFELCAHGHGFTAIAKALNADGAAAPRPQQGRPCAWTPSTVRDVLKRPLYRGEIVWNQTAKRDRWGQKRPQAKPADMHLTLAAPELRVVSDELWTAAHEQMRDRRSKYDQGNRPQRASNYLLSGFAQCAVCGGGFASHLRRHGGRSVAFYACTAHWKRGATVCGNGLVGRMAEIDAEVLETLKVDVLHPAVVERAITLAAEALSPASIQAQRDRLEGQLHLVEQESTRLAEAIARGGPLDALLDRLHGCQADRDRLRAEVAALPAAPVNLTGLEQRLAAKLADWRTLLAQDVEAGRQVLRVLLTGPLRFTPIVDARRRGYAFTGTLALDRIVEGVVDLPPVNQQASKSAIGGAEHLLAWRPQEASRPSTPWSLTVSGYADLRVA